MTVTVRNRRRLAPPKPVQRSLLDHEIDGVMRLRHEIFLAGRSANFCDGVTTYEERRARCRQALTGIAELASRNRPGMTLRQLFEETYREAL